MNATAQASAALVSGPKLDNRRVLAALVDLGIVLAGTLVILFAADALSSDTGEIRGALGAVILGWALYYHFAMESGDGQTVGKKLMKLRVVLANGRPAGMREIAVRTVLRVVDGIGGYIVGLIVMLATGQRRQRLGDLAAGTMVVDASATPYAPPAPVEETDVEDEPVESPAPADLAAPEAPALPEMRPFDPPMAEDEPVEDAEPVVDEVVEDEPVEVEPVAVETYEPVAVETYEPVAVETYEPVEDETYEPVVDEVVEPDEAEPVAAVEVVEPVEDDAYAPVEDEPVALVTAVEDEPVVPVALVAPLEDEPVAALTVVEDVEDDAAEDEPAVPLAVVQVDEPLEDELPELSTPSLDELARDVAAAGTEDEPDEEPMTLRSVETVSAIDLVMSAADEDESSEQDQAPEGPAAS
ncbi:MAG TPA: RDD family protein [Thermoleophilaceae bacterium]|nr:RDD family protein [Thermoleophilaceae bacterium]